MRKLNEFELCYPTKRTFEFYQCQLCEWSGPNVTMEIINRFKANFVKHPCPVCRSKANLVNQEFTDEEVGRFWPSWFSALKELGAFKELERVGKERIVKRVKKNV